LSFDKKFEKRENLDVIIINPNRKTWFLCITEYFFVLFSEGPFTVLAPTNEAFAEIPPEDLEALLQDKPALTAVLLRHVISGKVGTYKTFNLNHVIKNILMMKCFTL
jgi:hypothetical protein